MSILKAIHDIDSHQKELIPLVQNLKEEIKSLLPLNVNIEFCKDEYSYIKFQVQEDNKIIFEIVDFDFDYILDKAKNYITVHDNLKNILNDYILELLCTYSKGNN